jgi:microcystin-dependent protein
MKISMTIGSTRPTLIQRVNTGDNELYIDGSRVAPSQWVGTEYYTFTKNDNEYSIKKAEANMGNITLKIIDDYNYELVQIASGSPSGGLTIDNIYPIGSIYMSVSSTNPETLFPNTVWSPLQNRMLIGAGDSYAVNDTGGETTHVLTSSEMPSHNHSPYTYGVSGSGSVNGDHYHSYNSLYYHSHSFSGDSHYHDTGHTGSINFLTVDYGVNVKINNTPRNFPSTSSNGIFFVYSDSGGLAIHEQANTGSTSTGGSCGYAGQYYNDSTTGSSGSGSSLSLNINASVAEYDRGGGSAHNNMPPYLAVYMWKRTG